MGAILLSDRRWPEVESLLARDDRLIIVTGATEQHGHHLPIGTDVMIPLEIARRLSVRSGVPIAPPIPLGMSESHMAYPGTLTLSDETLRAVYLELLQSVYRQGWRRLFVINGHGGNIPAWEWAATLAAKIKHDLRIYVSHWWTEESARALVRERMGRNEGHAGLEESAAMLVAAPERVVLEQAEATLAPDDLWDLAPEALRAVLGAGAIGVAPQEATVELGDAMLERLVTDYVALLDGGWT